jgi:hypothetical protein
MLIKFYRVPVDDLLSFGFISAPNKALADRLKFGGIVIYTVNEVTLHMVHGQ